MEEQKNTNDQQPPGAKVMSVVGGALKKSATAVKATVGWIGPRAAAGGKKLAAGSRTALTSLTARLRERRTGSTSAEDGDESVGGETQ